MSKHLYFGQSFTYQLSLPVFSQVFQHVTEIDKEQKYDQASLISITIQHQPKKKKKDKLKGIVSLIPFNQFRTLRR